MKYSINSYLSTCCGYGAILICIIILLVSCSIKVSGSHDVNKASFLIAFVSTLPLIINAIWDCLIPIFLRRGSRSLVGVLHLILVIGFSAPIIFLLVNKGGGEVHYLLMFSGFWSSISVAHVILTAILTIVEYQETTMMCSTYRIFSKSTQCWCLLLSSILSQLFLLLSIYVADFMFLVDTFQLLVCAQSFIFLVCHVIAVAQLSEHISPNDVTLLWHLVLLTIRIIADNIITFSHIYGKNSAVCGYTLKLYLQLAYVVAVLTLPEKHSTLSTVQNLLQIIEEKTAATRYVSHELRTPLNIIHLSLIYIRAEVAKLSLSLASIILAPIIMAIDDVNDSCDTAISILDELLTMDKIQAGKLIVEFEDIEPIGFVQNTFRQFCAIATQNNIMFEFLNDIDATSSLQVHVDAQKLGQVLRNLLSNAFKFTPHGGAVTVRIGLAHHDELHHLVGRNNGNDLSSIIFPVNNEVGGVNNGNQKRLEVRIIDTGAGISPTNQHKLFGQYVQFNAKTLQQGKGSGLGLWISKGIVKLHGGTLTAESAGEGHGCTFVLQLPLQEIVQQQESVRVQVHVHQHHLENYENRFASPSSSRSERSRSIRRESVSEVVVQTRSYRNKESTNSSEEGNGSSTRIFKSDISSGLELTPLIFPESPVANDQIEISRAGFIHSAPVRLHTYTHVDFGSSKISKDAERVQKTSLSFLLVDDSKLCRKAVSRLLQAAGHTVTEAGDGAEALFILLETNQSNSVDVILIDNYMPSMSGPEVTRKVREQGFEGIIIALTGDLHESEVQAFITGGADHALLKPLNMVQLAVILGKYFVDIALVPASIDLGTILKQPGQL